MTILTIDIRLAWLNLVQHRRRSMLLGTAIAVVTCFFVILATLSEGVERTLSDSAVTITTGHLNVNGIFKISPGQAAPIIVDYSRVADVVKRSVPEADFIVQRGRGEGKIIAENASAEALLNGVEISAEPGLRALLRLNSGKIEDLARPNSILVFEQQAKALSLTVGDAVTISTETLRGAANTGDFRVVAIARDIGILSTSTVFTSLQTLRALYQVRPDVTGVLQIHVKPQGVDDISGIQERLRNALERAGYRVMPRDPRVFWEKLGAVTTQGWTGQKLDITTWQDEVSFLRWSYGALQGVSGLLLAVLLAITICGVMNSLWVATRERTREIGTLRAIGMQRGAVARLFMLEAALLCLIASISGSVVAIFLTRLVNAADVRVPSAAQVFLMRDTLQLGTSPSTILCVLGFMLSAVSLAAVFPAFRAAARKPIDAMAHLD